MSYDIVKSIKVKDGRVFIKSASNNVYPHYYDEWESSSLTKILQEEGQEKLDIAVLREFESGNFQGNAGKYTKPLVVLRHLPEYQDFDWRAADYDRVSVNRKTPEFEELLKKALYTKLPKPRYIIKKNWFGRTVYLKWARRRTGWIDEKAKAKQFYFAADCEWIKKCYTNTDAWMIEEG